MPDIEQRRAQVFALRAQGYTQQAIADKLHASRRTIQTDCKALDARNPLPVDDVIQEWQRHLSSGMRLLFVRFLDGFETMDSAEAGRLLIRMWPMFAQVYGIDKRDADVSVSEMLAARAAMDKRLGDDIENADDDTQPDGPSGGDDVSLADGGATDTRAQGE